MNEEDYSTILSHQNGNKNYDLKDYASYKDRGTCYDMSQSECGKDNDLIDTGSYYWLYSAYDDNNLDIWDPKGIKISNNKAASMGIRPIIKLDYDINIDESSGDGSSSHPYKLINTNNKANELVGKFVSYTPDNKTWSLGKDGVSDSSGYNAKTFSIYDYYKESSAVGKSKNDNIICGSGSNYEGVGGWRIMDVSSSGQITLIHASIPECYVEDTTTSYDDAAMLKRVSTASSPGESKAWTKYGNSTYAESVHYYDEKDYTKIIQNYYGSKDYYLKDYKEDSTGGTCNRDSKYNSMCRRAMFSLVYGGRFIYIAANKSDKYMFDSCNLTGSSCSGGQRWGVRPVIVLKSNVKIKEDGQDGSVEKPFNLTT